MWRRRAVYPILFWLLLTLVVAAAWIRLGDSNLTTVLTIVSTLVALLPVLKVGPLRWSVPAQASTRQQVDQALEMLAVEVRTQWDEEARRRRLHDTRQMLVRWDVRDRPAGPRQIPAQGGLPRLVDEFAARPGPMVVIGEPGSGKTGLCVILTLDLLDEVVPGRIPVLIQVASWDPTENLDNWLVRRLVEDYPLLGSETQFGSTAARDIVAQRLVLPILDGLDEMPAELRPAALRAIEDDWSADSRPFVLTCRTDEFLAANDQNLLAGVLVVRLLPLEPQAAANYLLEASSDERLDDWEVVLADLVDHPTGLVARVLTKPLMLSLARSVYVADRPSPRELLDTHRFPRETDIEEHLLDRFIPTVFRTRPPRDVPSPTRPSRQWDPEQADRTLTLLARYLQQQGTHDLAWWQLYRTMPPWVSHVVRVVVGTLACGLLAWMLFGLFGRPEVGIGFGLLVGFVASLPLGNMRERRPRRFVPRMLRRRELAPRYLARDISFGLVGVMVGGVSVGLLYDIGYGLVIGLFFGLVFGIARRFTEPTESKEPVSPVSVLRSDRSTVLYAVALGGVAGALVGGFLGGVVGAGERGLVFDLNPVQEGALGAAVGMLVGAGGLGMLVHATSAWGRFLLARVWFASRLHTPLRLMTFLQDAHKLGVLRQLGPLYQFRHALLEEHLAQPRDARTPAPSQESPVS